MATAKVRLYGPGRDQVEVRVLLDQGSEASFITTSLVQLLNLEQRSVHVPVAGIGVSSVDTGRSSAYHRIQSLTYPDYQIDCDAQILPQTKLLPSRNTKAILPNVPSDLDLADPAFHVPAGIDLILGVEVYARTLRPGVRGIFPSSVIAQSIMFGWVLTVLMMSKAIHSTKGSTVLHTCITTPSDEILIKILRKFWELEEVPTNFAAISPDNQRCETFYVETHSRRTDRRYVIRLPLSSNPPLVANATRRLAYNSLLSMERRFIANPLLNAAYKNFMQEYEILGHMELVPMVEIDNPRAWYLPHHAVFRSGTSGFKIRVVFDASRAALPQESLNKYLTKGWSTLARDLTLIVADAFVADIIKMYRKICVHDDDCDLQRILWRESHDTPPKAYRLKMVTYGTS